jgi:O-antigen/teichoic acid export membrane protein
MNIDFMLSLVVKATGPILGLFILFFISNQYGKDIVGFYTVLIQVLIFSSVLIRSGGDFLMIKFAPQLELSTNSEFLKCIFKDMLIGSTVFSIIIYLFFIYGDYDIEFIQYIAKYQGLFILSAIVFSVFNLAVSYLVAIQRAKESIVYQSLLFQLLLLFFYILLPKKIESIFISITLTSVVLILVIIISKKRLLTSRHSMNFSGLLKVRLKGFVYAISELLMFNSDLIILSLFVTLSEVASYALASRVVMMYGFYVQVQNAYLSGKISNILTSSNYGLKLKKLFWSTVVVNIAFIFPYLFFIYAIENIVITFFSDEYGSLHDYLIIMLGVGVVGIVFGFSVNFFFLISREKTSFWATQFGLGWSILYVITLMLSTMFYGALGLAYAVLILKLLYYFLYFGLNLYYVERIDN